MATLNIRICLIATREAANTLDLRVEKTFSLPKSTARLGLFIDVFNVGNQGAPNPTAFRPVYELSGPRFGRPDSWDILT